MAAASSNFLKVSLDTFRSVAVKLFALIEFFQSICSGIAIQCSRLKSVNTNSALSLARKTYNASVRLVLKCSLIAIA